MKRSIIHLLLLLPAIYPHLLSGQISVDIMGKIKSKYASSDVVCGKISVHEEHPEYVRDYEKWVFADNRSGMARLIYIPQLQRTYYFNGAETWILDDQDHTYVHESDARAVAFFLQKLDHISKLLLTRAKSGNTPPENLSADLKEEITRISDKDCQITIRSDDVPEYFIRDNQLVLDFKIENPELTKTRMTYFFLDDLVLEEHSLDTVYRNPTQVDSLLLEVQRKLSFYTPKETLMFEEEKPIDIPFREIYDQLKFVNVSPSNSEYYLFDFYYIQCPPCLKAIPQLKQLQAAFPQSVLSIIAINPYDSHDRIMAFLEKSQITYSSSMMDKEVLNNRGGVMPYPTFVLFDKNGTVLWQKDGYTESLFEEVSAIITKE